MKNILQIFKNKTPDKQAMQKGQDHSGENRDIHQRLEDIYGQEMMQLQTLYEKQVTRDSWLLKDEAIWLISGIDPKRCKETDEEIRRKVNDLWEHARKCVEEGLLKVVNREVEPEQWEVRPVDIYQWARISRVELPDVFSSLMGYIVNTIKPAKPAPVSGTANHADGSVQEFDLDREAVLGMALAVLAAFPERCRSSSGRIRADRIVSIIEDKEKFWLADRQISMSTTARRDLINKWLVTVPSQQEN